MPLKNSRLNRNAIVWEKIFNLGVTEPEIKIKELSKNIIKNEQK